MAEGISNKDRQHRKTATQSQVRSHADPHTSVLPITITNSSRMLEKNKIYSTAAFSCFQYVDKQKSGRENSEHSERPHLHLICNCYKLAKMKYKPISTRTLAALLELLDHHKIKVCRLNSNDNGQPAETSTTCCLNHQNYSGSQAN